MKITDSLINIFLLVICLIAAFLVFLIPFIKSKKRINDFAKERKDLILAFIVLCIGSITRLCLLDKFPEGLNQDEASSGYDAYSIMNWGVDRNNMEYPVHLIAWGSGQNALYSYIVIPFLKILGNTTIALRLPMAIVGTLSLYFIYFSFDKINGHRFALLSLTLLAILPWHIMKSRFALESNLFPDLVLWGMLALMLSIYKKNNVFFYISCLIFGLSSYSYGTSYFFLFFFVISMLLYITIKKYQKWYHSLIYLFLMGVICLPIILFLYINLFGKETMHILFFTIPKLKAERFHSVTSIFSKNFFSDVLNNLSNGIQLIYRQDDSLPWNSIPYFGTLYLFTLPFSFLGFFRFKDRKSKLLYDVSPEEKAKSMFYFLLLSSFFVSFVMMMLLSANINRINIIWMPLYLSACFGIETFLKKIKMMRIPVGALYAVSYISFAIYYPLKWCPEKINPSFYHGLMDCILYAKDKEYDDLYLTTGANYTLFLYYSEYDVHDYINSVTYTNLGSAFENPREFSNIHCYLPSKVEEGNIYIVKNTDSLYKVDTSSFKAFYSGNYMVIDTLK